MRSWCERALQVDLASAHCSVTNESHAWSDSSFCPTTTSWIISMRMGRERTIRIFNWFVVWFADGWTDGFWLTFLWQMTAKTQRSVAFSCGISQNRPFVILFNRRQYNVMQYKAAICNATQSIKVKTSRTLRVWWDLWRYLENHWWKTNKSVSQYIAECTSIKSNEG